MSDLAAPSFRGALEGPMTLLRWSLQLAAAALAEEVSPVLLARLHADKYTRLRTDRIRA